MQMVPYEKDKELRSAGKLANSFMPIFTTGEFALCVIRTSYQNYALFIGVCIMICVSANYHWAKMTSSSKTNYANCFFFY